MAINEADLPGVGKKFWLNTSAGEKLTIIIHNSGKREIYRFQKGEDFPSSVIEMSDEEAHRVGAVLSGQFFQPFVVDSMDMWLKELSIEWINVSKMPILMDKSIRELQLRKKTGVSIVAIIRDNHAIPSPDPNEILHESDTLMLVGNREHLSNFKRFTGV